MSGAQVEEKWFEHTIVLGVSAVAPAVRLTAVIVHVWHERGAADYSAEGLPVVAIRCENRATYRRRGWDDDRPEAPGSHREAVRAGWDYDRLGSGPQEVPIVVDAETGRLIEVDFLVGPNGDYRLVACDEGDGPFEAAVDALRSELLERMSSELAGAAGDLSRAADRPEGRPGERTRGQANHG